MNFIAVFFICLIIGFVGMFFLGSLILENIFGTITFFAFIAAILITSLLNLCDRIEQLEKRLNEIEGKSK